MIYPPVLLNIAIENPHVFNGTLCENHWKSTMFNGDFPAFTMGENPRYSIPMYFPSTTIPSEGSTLSKSRPWKPANWPSPAHVMENCGCQRRSFCGIWFLAVDWDRKTMKHIGKLMDSGTSVHPTWHFGTATLWLCPKLGDSNFHGFTMFHPFIFPLCNLSFGYPCVRHIHISSSPVSTAPPGSSV